MSDYDYEPAENAAAKDVVMDTLERSLSEQGRDPYHEDSEVDLITVADDVVEALLGVGAMFPETLRSPFLPTK